MSDAVLMQRIDALTSGASAKAHRGTKNDQEQMEVAVMKKDFKAWAIKLRGRNFRSFDGVPLLYTKKVDASAVAMRVEKISGATAQPIRVRVRIEEIE